MRFVRQAILASLLLLTSGVGWAVDLLQRYPTTLTEGSDQPRDWDFGTNDIFHLTQFKFAAGDTFRIEVESADLAIGHSSDGAVWAVVFPRETGKLHTQLTNAPEAIANIWLRFHPAKINELFPPQTVVDEGAKNRIVESGVIARAKLRNSYQANGRPIIPEPVAMTIDVDLTNRIRRFFAIDENGARYVQALEKQPVPRPPQIRRDLAESAFDQIWKEFDQSYAMFTLRPDLNWNSLRDEFRPKAVASQSTWEFADNVASMLKSLRDLHIGMTVAGMDVPVFNRPRSINANPAATRIIFPKVQTEGRDLAWATTISKIGYISIRSWSDAETPERFEKILEEMRDTRGLVLDVRLNGGGSENLAREVAGRFLSKDFVYAYSQYRSGPKHTDLGEKIPREVKAKGPWRYDRPVILLIGERCMSSNESFIAMMSGATNVTTMGDRTCGSSGNPKIIRLPLSITVSVPQWIDFLPDGTPLEEKGIQPSINFTPQKDSFEGANDDLLTAALDRLKNVSLPERPIAGSAFAPRPTMPEPLRRQAQNIKLSQGGPRVISVSPADGADAVSTSTELRIRFDQPVDPLTLHLHWLAGGFLESEIPTYNAETREYVVAIKLPPGALHQIAVNDPAIFAWKFRTAGAAEIPARFAFVPPPEMAWSSDPRLVGLLGAIQEKRRELTSVVQRVQTIYFRPHDGIFNHLDSTAAEFRWQAPDQFFADISSIMHIPFQIGCDGKNWWFLGKADLVACAKADMHEQNVSINDPFDLLKRTPEAAAQAFKLVYQGLHKRDGRPFHVIVQWNLKGQFKSGTEWWFDAASMQLSEIVETSDSGRVITRFHYDSTNKPLPAEKFAMPNVSPPQFEKLEEGFTERFVNLRDGSDGRMTVRWGKTGPKGRNSSGFN